MGDEPRKVFMDVYKEKELKKLFPIAFMESVKTCMKYADQAELFTKLIHMLTNTGAPARMWDDASDENYREVMLGALYRCISTRMDELDAERERLDLLRADVDVAQDTLLNNKAADDDDDDALAQALHYDPASIIAPPYLYHATPEDNVQNILDLGLLPMKRRYVYMYEDIDQAYMVGARHGSKVAVLRIDTKAFLAQGNALDKKNFGYGEVWLADAVPAIFVEDVPNYTPPQD